MEENQRFEINKRIIGKTVFVTTHGGFYGTVIDVNEDDVKVKYKDYTRDVSIWDVRQIDNSELYENP